MDAVLLSRLQFVWVVALHILLPALTVGLAAMGLFLMCYLGLGISIWLMVVPYSIPLWAAASSVKSQGFLLIGTLFLLPIIVMYTGWSYWVFRGKVKGGHTATASGARLASLARRQLSAPVAHLDR